MVFSISLGFIELLVGLGKLRIISALGNGAKTYFTGRKILLQAIVYPTIAYETLYNKYVQNVLHLVDDDVPSLHTSPLFRCHDSSAFETALPLAIERVWLQTYAINF